MLYKKKNAIIITVTTMVTELIISRIVTSRETQIGGLMNWSRLVLRKTLVVPIMKTTTIKANFQVVNSLKISQII
jgi:hypothetical protein